MCVVYVLFVLANVIRFFNFTKLRACFHYIFLYLWLAEDRMRFGRAKKKRFFLGFALTFCYLCVW